VVFDALPARADRTITITATDAEANSADCDVTLHVLAPKPVASHSIIDMLALTTSATQEYQIQIENVGDSVLKINTADVSVLGDAGEQWAAVKFQAGSQVVKVGQPGSHIVEVQPGASTVVFVQFDGVKAPDAAFCCEDGVCTVAGMQTAEPARQACEANSGTYKPLGKGGTFSSTLRIPTNDPNPDTSTVGISLIFTTVDTALVIVGLPRSIDMTMAPGSVNMQTVSVYNVWPDAKNGLDFTHVGAEESAVERSVCAGVATCTASDVMTTCSTASGGGCNGCCKVADPNNPNRDGICAVVSAQKMLPDTGVCCRENVCLFETWGTTQQACTDTMGTCTNPVDATTNATCAGTFNSTASWKATGVGSSDAAGIVTIESCTEHIDQGASITIPLQLHAPVTAGTCEFELPVQSTTLDKCSRANDPCVDCRCICLGSSAESAE
jgi:hypothetical protein